VASSGHGSIRDLTDRREEAEFNDESVQVYTFSIDGEVSLPAFAFTFQITVAQYATHRIFSKVLLVLMDVDTFPVGDGLRRPVLQRSVERADFFG
jgi:hypothetical protein